MRPSVWLLFLAVASIFCLVRSAEEIESSISSEAMTGHSMMASLRFYAITKTMSTTKTVLHLYTTYVRATCLSIPAGTKPCPSTTPAPTTTTTTTTPAPTTTTTTTTTPAPTTTTPTTTQGTTAAPVSTQPPFKIVEDQFKPSVSTFITVNKHTPPKLQLNFPQLGSGFGGLFSSRPPLNISVNANMNASMSSGNGRRRRSEIVVESIDPSLVRGLEATASPDQMPLGEAIQQDVAIETSKMEDEYHEYEIIGLMPQHFIERGLPFMNKATIVRVNPVTVTVSQTVTSTFPINSPSDRVTLAYTGCIPSGVPNLPSCA